MYYSKFFTLMVILLLTTVACEKTHNSGQLNKEKQHKFKEATNLIINCVTQRIDEKLKVYMNPEESIVSSKVLEIQVSPYINEISSITMVDAGEKNCVGFIAGTMVPQNAHLIVVQTDISNPDSQETSFYLGDFKLIADNEVELPIVAVSKNNSYMIAKTNERSSDITNNIVITINANEKIKINICYAVPNISSVLEYQFQERSIIENIQYETLDVYRNISTGTTLEMAGNMTLYQRIAPLKTNGFILDDKIQLIFNAEGIDIPEEKYPDGVRFAAYVGREGARSINSRKIIEKIDGQESRRELSEFYMFEQGVYLSGSIQINSDILPFKITRSLENLKAEILYTCEYKFNKDDVIAAIGEISNGGTVLSLKTLD